MTRHAGEAAAVEVDAGGARVGGVHRVARGQRDAPPRCLQRAAAGDRLRIDADLATTVVEHRGVVLAFGQRRLVLRVGQHLGHAASAEAGRAGLRAPQRACLQEDRAVGLDRGVGRHAAVLVDGQRRQRDVAAVGGDEAGVAHQVAQVDVDAMARLDLDLEAAQGRIGRIGQRQVGLATGSQDHLAVGRRNQACAVLHPRREDDDRATGVGGDRRRGRVGRARGADADARRQGAVGPQSERVALLVVATFGQRRGESPGGQRTGVVAGVADVQCRGQQRLHVDLGAAVEQDAVLVDQQHLAIGGELALDDAGVGAVDAVQDRRGRTRLVEAHLGVAGDVERFPVEDGALRDLIDGEQRAARASHRRIHHHLPRHHPAQHRQRAGRQRSTLRLHPVRAGDHAQRRQHQPAAAVRTGERARRARRGSGRLFHTGSKACSRDRLGWRPIVRRVCDRTTGSGIRSAAQMPSNGKGRRPQGHRPRSGPLRGQRSRPDGSIS